MEVIMKKYLFVLLLFLCFNNYKMQADNQCLTYDRPFLKIGGYKRIKCYCDCKKFHKGYQGKCIKCKHKRFKLNYL